jgi:hypothetical protein
MSTRNLPGVIRGWRIRLTPLSSSLSQLPRKCGSLDVTQPYGPPWPVTGVVLPSLYFFVLLNAMLMRYRPTKCFVCPVTGAIIFRKFASNCVCLFMKSEWTYSLVHGNRFSVSACTSLQNTGTLIRTFLIKNFETLDFWMAYACPHLQNLNRAATLQNPFTQCLGVCFTQIF